MTLVWKRGTASLWQAVGADGGYYEIKKQPFPIGGDYFALTFYANESAKAKSLGGSNVLTNAKKMAEDHAAKEKKAERAFEEACSFVGI